MNKKSYVIAIVGLTIATSCSILGQFVEPDGSPTNLGILSISRNRVHIGWIDNATNESGYSVERKIGADGVFFQIATTSAGAANYLDSGLTSETKYYYRVRAFNDSGYSSYSTEISVYTLGSGNTELEPAIEIVSPMDGSTVTVPFDIEFTTTDWGHSDSGSQVTHFHPLIGNGENLDDKGAVMDLDSPYTVTGLEPGFYTIKFKLANSDHTFIGVEDTIEVTVTE